MASGAGASGGLLRFATAAITGALLAALLAALLGATACSSSARSSSGGGDGGAGGDDGSTSTQSGSSQASSGSGSGASTSGSGTVSSSSSGGSGNPFDAAAKLCFDTINMHRASIGLPPYTRWTDGEECAGDECMQDSQSGTPHGAFPQCGEFGQNECPGWPGPPENMIEGCLQMMWDEGPGQDFSKHGHYLNMSSQQFTSVACGFYVEPNGDVWSIQNFK